MQENRKNGLKLERARKHVAAVKGFYNHLFVYLFVNLGIFFLYAGYRFINTGYYETLEVGFRNWIDWNILFTPLFWGIGLFFHGLSVFGRKPRFLKKWEVRQIKKYMEE
ncbi:2TM domain-containing protein [Arenibacter latericius]|uniref:2TM domain-containing protein n=1 Tax=Arenibacter latericius TaxID=86104 RepID=UPI00041A77BC|nr:2TM domain-containing protein [Arenibacter latericius]MDX1364458.1 2TM domain-containing protein [Arenibacter latericius]